MKISTQIELLVREAFAASVSQEEDRFDAAGAAIASRGDQAFTDALNLGLSVCAVALFAVHEGQRPDDGQLAYLAGAFTESETWAEPDEGDALTFLTALADHEPVEDLLALEDITLLVFVMGAWLLSGFLPENKHWYNFLDEIERELESEPGE